MSKWRKAVLLVGIVWVIAGFLIPQPLPGVEAVFSDTCVGGTCDYLSNTSVALISIRTWVLLGGALLTATALGYTQ